MRQNPAKTPSPSTVAYVVINPYDEVNVIIVDSGRIVGGMLLENPNGDRMIGELKERSTHALHGWGPLLYTSVFAWARRKGFDEVHSDINRLNEAERVWWRFEDSKIAKHKEERRYEIDYWVVNLVKPANVKRLMQLEGAIPPPPFVEISSEKYDKHPPKWGDGSKYKPSPSRTPDTPEEWPAWPAALSRRENPAQGRTDTTVLFAVGPTTASRYTLVLVDNGEVKGGMTMKAGKSYCQITAVNALKSWGPLLYRAAFTWAHNMGFTSVYSDTTVFQGAHKIWNHFIDREGIGERLISSMGKYRMRPRGSYADVPIIQISQEDYEAYGPKVPGLRGPQSAIGDWPYVPLVNLLNERYPVTWPSGPYPKK